MTYGDAVSILHDLKWLENERLPATAAISSRSYSYKTGSICTAQIQPRKHVLDRADHEATPRQEKVQHADHELQHTDQESISPEISTTDDEVRPVIYPMCEMLTQNKG